MGFFKSSSTLIDKKLRKVGTQPSFYSVSTVPRPGPVALLLSRHSWAGAQVNDRNTPGALSAGVSCRILFLGPDWPRDLIHRKD